VLLVQVAEGVLESVLRREKGILHDPDLRLWPWHQDVEQQATECHTDRERVHRDISPFNHPASLATRERMRRA
jgi:hypothetical protein